MSTLEELTREIEEERRKQKELEDRLSKEMKLQEEYVTPKQRKQVLGNSSVLTKSLKTRLKNLQRQGSPTPNSQDSSITSMLQEKLNSIITEQAHLENALEQEQECILQNLCFQLASAITEQLQLKLSEIQRKLEADKAMSGSDAESAKMDEIFTDSSMSSDSESSREIRHERRGRQQSELRRIKHNMRIAKQEMLKCNFKLDQNIYEQLNKTKMKIMHENEGVVRRDSERDDLSDTSMISIGSLSSFDPSLNTSQEVLTPVRSREASSTPRQYRQLQ